MYEWPILLGLSLGKSIYSDYRSFSCILLVLVFLQLTHGHQLDFFTPSFTHQPIRIRGTKISFLASVLRIKIVSSEAVRGNRKKSATLLALQISFIMTLIVYYADSTVSSLTF